MSNFLWELLLSSLLCALPLFISIFTAMLILKNYSLAIYRTCWLNILLYCFYSFMFSLWATYKKETNRGDARLPDFLSGFIFFSFIHLIFFWIWLYKVRPKKQAETAEKSKILDEDDPILDEQPPIK
jgi:cbb3-type cytochrome oxidase subunit 3